MRPTLQVRLTQHLALTPQLQQSIRLLQLSTVELSQEVEQMLEANPFLEPDVEEDAPVAAPGERPREQERERERERSDEPDLTAADQDAPDTTDWDDSGEPALGGDWPTAGGSGGDDDQDPHARTAAAPTLQAHLRQQLSGMRLGDEDAASVLALIESLDDNGYLADPLESIADRLAQALDITSPDAFDALLDQLRCGLRWLQSLEPTGVGAADLAECLALQLATQPPGPARDTALLIATRHLDLLAKRDLRRLTQLTGADEALLKQAHALIMACEPKPARPFTPTEQQALTPDVIVQRVGRQWRAALNPEVMPRLRIHEAYAQALRGQGRGHSPMAGRLQEARWFIRNIQQRFDTILRVSQAIVERQKGFFTHGAIAMKPLVLREIADELGLHESTISRVTTAKYMTTPQGTFELKYFFGSSLATEAGGNASSTAVRALIKQFIDAEDPLKPLSDSQIADMLEQQGIQVARRTVAKYREAMKIMPATLRKQL
ncbi:MAG: RNA polymerase factor sigma-54 [Proteobacteria bacterium]|nr:RNA polymerase factor sigma-54 [Pseudomonadota bacterium]